jgi:hypothetical protein
MAPLHRFRVLPFLGAALILAGGCSLLRGSGPNPFLAEEAGEEPTFRLRIENAMGADARVQIVWGASAELLGEIQAGDGRNFHLPLKGRSFRLHVDFPQGGRGWETPPFFPREGQFLRYRIGQR